MAKAVDVCRDPVNSDVTRLFGGIAVSELGDRLRLVRAIDVDCGGTCC